MDFWDNDIWPGNSNFNPAEDIGTIIKDDVEVEILGETGRGRYSYATLLYNLKVLRSTENRTELFEDLCFYVTGIIAVKTSNGLDTNF